EREAHVPASQARLAIAPIQQAQYHLPRAIAQPFGQRRLRWRRRLLGCRCFASFGSRSLALPGLGFDEGATYRFDITRRDTRLCRCGREIPADETVAAFAMMQVEHILQVGTQLPR